LIAGQFKKILEAEKITYQEDLLPALAKMARGSMRDGLSLLDRLISTGIEPLSLKLLFWRNFWAVPTVRRCII
jgi:DNA polymerase-3 subunit gamma/tau